ncbi:cytochrome P450 3A29-like [Glandiceps talaboti]
MEIFGVELPELSISPIWLILVALLVMIYLYGTWPYSLFKQLDIPGPKPVPFAGNMFQVFQPKGMHEVINDWKEQYGNLYGMYFGREPFLVVSDLDLLRDILVKKFYCFTNRREATICQEPLSSGLGALRDKKWKYVRTVLTPAFSVSKLKQLSLLVKHCNDVLMKNLQTAADKDKVIDFKEMFGAYSNDCVLSTAFGVEVDSQNEPENTFVKNIKKMLNAISMNLLLILRIFFPFLRPLLDFLNLKVIPVDLMNYFVASTNQTIDLRKSEANPRQDLLQLMLNAHNEVKDEDLEGEERVKLTNNEILGQSLTFYLAGYETTSTMLSYAVYLLATNTDIQERLREEIDTVMQNYDSPGYEAQQQMKYLDQVCCETLRLYPPAISTDRQCNEDCLIGRDCIFIPKGMNIHIPIWAVHHDPDVYTDPDTFDPDRFSQEKKQSLHPYAWLPFGGGPRICLGMRLAMMEAKFSLVEILRNFTIETCSETEIPPEVGKKGFLSPVNGIKLKLKKREESESVSSL